MPAALAPAAANAARNALEVRNLNFYYGKFQGLKNVSIDIAERKVTAFIGPSGCGKSTLLRTLNRMYSLYPGQRAEGQISFYGQNILDDKQDLNLTEDVEPLEEIVDELSKELKRRHINRLRSGECTIEMGFILTDLLTSLERIADHCSNISVCITQVRENLYDTHRHLNAMKNDQDDEFNKCLEAVRKEYLLP